MARNRLANYDWIKISIAAALSLYLCQKIYTSIEKLNENRMDSTETGRGTAYSFRLIIFNNTFKNKGQTTGQN